MIWEPHVVGGMCPGFPASVGPSTSALFFSEVGEMIQVVLDSKLLGQTPAACQVMHGDCPQPGAQCGLTRKPFGGRDACFAGAGMKSLFQGFEAADWLS